MAWKSSKWCKFWLWSSIWPWRSLSIIPQNNIDLNQCLLHLWSQFGDPRWNWWWVIARTSSWLTHGRTHRQTDTGNDNNRRPKLALGNEWVSIINYIIGWVLSCWSTNQTSTIRTPMFWEYPRSLPMNKFQTRSPINELGRDLDPRYVSTKFDRDQRRIALGRAVIGLAGQND